MVRVIWSDRALTDLDGVAYYIERFNPSAAANMKDRLFALGESLTHFPNRGRPASNSARELTSVPPYVLRYRVVGETVLIVRVRHGRQRPLR